MAKQSLVSLWRETFVGWIRDEALTRAAALAYYTLFSLAPMLIIALSVAKAYMGEAAAQGELESQLQRQMGPESAKAIQTLIENSKPQSLTWSANFLSTLLLVFSATAGFAELQSALNIFWKVPPASTGTIKLFVRARALSFLLVMAIGVVLMGAVIVSTVISAIGNLMPDHVTQSPFWVQGINHLLSFVGATVLFALLYKVLPDRQIGFRDVWFGAMVTSLLFNVGNFILGIYLTRSSSSQLATGPLAVLLWIYGSSLTLLLGAKFTAVYARAHEDHRRQPVLSSQSRGTA